MVLGFPIHKHFRVLCLPFWARLSIITMLFKKMIHAYSDLFPGICGGVDISQVLSLSDIFTDS